MVDDHIENRRKDILGFCRHTVLALLRSQPSPLGLPVLMVTSGPFDRMIVTGTRVGLCLQKAPEEQRLQDNLPVPLP